MTKDRDEKDVIRARMAKTGESYAAARAQLARDEAPQSAGAKPVRTPPDNFSTTVTAGRVFNSLKDTGSAWHLVLALRGTTGVAGRVLGWLGMPDDLQAPPVQAKSPAAASRMGAMHAAAGLVVDEGAGAIDSGRLLRGAVAVLADAEVPAEQAPFAAHIGSADLAGLCAAAARELGPEDADRAGASPPGLFTRFNGQARMVIVYAQEEARGLDHHYIGTEHLLLGLLREGGGVGTTVLSDHGVALETMRATIVDLIGRGGSPASGHIPFTPRAKRLLEAALRIAVELPSEYIRTEHLLLATVEEADGVAAQVLRDAGLTAEVVRERVLTVLAAVSPDSPQDGT